MLNNLHYSLQSNIMNKEHYLKENKVYPELLSLSTSLVLLTNTFLLITYPGIEQHNFLF